MSAERQIILDTETTGLHPQNGDRLVEIGCIELVNRRMTGNTLHFYVNPQRNMPEEAAAIHGLREDFLADKPIFSQVANEIESFVRGAEVIIHNASFDLGFLDMEFKRLGKNSFSSLLEGVIDTLLEAQKMFPGKRNRLDDLCNRFGIRNDHRKLHGALLDAELLAEVYLSMTRGQNDLGMDLTATAPLEHLSEGLLTDLPANLSIQFANSEELSEHEQILQEIEKNSKQRPIWAH